MKDEYISVEHLFLALLENGGPCGKTLEDCGCTKDKALMALI